MVDIRDDYVFFGNYIHDPVNKYQDFAYGFMSPAGVITKVKVIELFGDAGDEYISGLDYDRTTDTFFSTALVTKTYEDYGFLLSINPKTQLVNYILEISLTSLETSCDWVRVD